ncbi:tetratricopeptide repeat-containing sensor histidine kinase [Chryseobacterium indologenes]|uniref:tetratricopeptide repeat-containing sensor histidine kinase n=1 Tax=Chryseobacterium indologenes TaxID=253 RepID=UPI001BCF3976|nr:tetratricopeptide repeat-containing sensor histidine kinase [Chryseobacterium indologenes]
MIRNLLFSLFSFCLIASCKDTLESNTNIVKADKLYEEGVSLLEKNDVKAYLKLQEAISYYNKESDFSNISKSLIVQANAQKNRGDFLGAESTLVEALKMMSENDESLYSLYDTMATLKLNQKQYSQAIEWYDKALSVKIESGQKRLSILNNKSVAEYKLGKYKLALDILQKLDLSKLSDLKLKNRIKENIEYTKWLDNNNYEAQATIENILKLKLENNDLWGANSSYAHLAEINKKSNPEKSLYYAKKMLDIAQINKSPEDRLEALEKIIYVDKPTNTNSHFITYKNLSDSIQNSRSDYTTKFAFIKYENTKVKAEKAEKENQLLWLSLVLALLTAIFIVVVILYKKRQKRLQQEKEIEVKNTQLKISKKVHDVVANGIYQVMTKIENQEDFDRDKALDELEFVYEKSRDISYDKTAEEKEFSKVISELIASFTNDIVKTFTAGNSPGIWEPISSTVKEEIYQMLRELMVNMKKHSQATHVAVKFEKINNRVEIQYKDNGIGISGDLVYKNGLRNTASRIEAINGTITFDTKIEKGLKVNLSFPAS